MFAPRAAGPCWFRNSWDCRRDKAVVGRSRACDKFWSRISQGGGGGLRDSVCGRAGKGEGEGGWVKMMGRPGAPATKRNNAPNKSMAGFPFGCFVLEVGHLTVVEQAGGALGSHKVGAGQSRELRENCKQVPPRCPLHHHLQHAACKMDALSTQEQLRETTEKRPLAAGAGGPLDLLSLSLIQALAPWASLSRHNKVGALLLDRHATSSLFPNAVKMWRQGPLSIHQTLRLPSIAVLFVLPSLSLSQHFVFSSSDNFRHLWTPCCQPG